MASKKISQLTSASTPLTGTEELAIVQGGQTLKATAQDVADLAGAPYLVYTALLTQDGSTTAPVATVIENTIGNIVWTRSGVGSYSATLTGAFTLNKTVVFASNVQSAGDAYITVINPASVNEITLYSRDQTGSPVELYTEVPMSIEIRVYP